MVWVAGSPVAFVLVAILLRGDGHQEAEAIQG